MNMLLTRILCEGEGYTITKEDWADAARLAEQREHSELLIEQLSAFIRLANVSPLYAEYLASKKEPFHA